MKTVDEILAIIDTGLQTAGDMAYGNDWPHTCWRCGDAAEDLCELCRTVLLDETTTGIAPVGLQLREAIERLNEAFRNLNASSRRRILDLTGAPPISGSLRRSNDRNNTRSSSE